VTVRAVFGCGRQFAHGIESVLGHRIGGTLAGTGLSARTLYQHTVIGAGRFLSLTYDLDDLTKTLGTLVANPA